MGLALWPNLRSLLAQSARHQESYPATFWCLFLWVVHYGHRTVPLIENQEGVAALAPRPHCNYPAALTRGGNLKSPM